MEENPLRHERKEWDVLTPEEVLELRQDLNNMCEKYGADPLWNILTALRGPDWSVTGTTKERGTAVIRGLIVPDWCPGNVNTYGDFGFEQEEIDAFKEWQGVEAKDRPYGVPASSHFFNHLALAARNLGLTKKSIDIYNSDITMINGVSAQHVTNAAYAARAERKKNVEQAGQNQQGDGSVEGSEGERSADAGPKRVAIVEDPCGRIECTGCYADADEVDAIARVSSDGEGGTDRDGAATPAAEGEEGKEK